MMLWLAVTNDAFELPVAVADNGTELAHMLRLPLSSVYNSLSEKRKTLNCKILKLEVNENEIEED